MRAGLGLYQLSCDAHAMAGLADAALYDVAHTEFVAYPPHVHGAALVAEAGLSSDHEQPSHARQRHEKIIDHAVREIFLLRVAADVAEWQHSD